MNNKEIRDDSKMENTKDITRENSTKIFKSKASGKWFRQNLDIYLALLIWFFHMIIIVIFYHIYGTIWLNRYISYYFVNFINIVVFEIALLSAMANTKHIRHIVISLIISFITAFIIGGPLTILALTIYSITINASVILGGIVIGKLIRFKLASNTYKFIKYGLVIVFLLSIFSAVSLAIKLETCDSFYGDGLDTCYFNKAFRHNNANVCSKIYNRYEKNLCLEKVLFNFDNNNYKSIKQCDIIVDNTDKEYCYMFFAKEKEDINICNNLIKNRKIREKCLNEVDECFCNKLSDGDLKNYCSKRILIRKYGNEGISEEEMKNFKNNEKTLGKLYEEYKQRVRKENSIGDTSHLNSRRLADIDHIRFVAKKTIALVNECQKRGKIVKSGFMDESMCGTYAETWSRLNACGNDNTDTKWIIVYNNKEWDYTLECKRYPECSGIENLKCTKNGCIFSEECKTKIIMQ